MAKHGFGFMRFKKGKKADEAQPAEAGTAKGGKKGSLVGRAQQLKAGAGRRGGVRV